MAKIGSRFRYAETVEYGKQYLQTRSSAKVHTAFSSLAHVERFHPLDTDKCRPGAVRRRHQQPPRSQNFGGRRDRHRHGHVPRWQVQRQAFVFLVRWLLVDGALASAFPFFVQLA